MTVTVDYYMTLTSPWTYLGSAPFAEIARRNNVDRQHQALQVRTDLRADRRAAAAEALAAAARLPDDGVEALARGAGCSARSSSPRFPLRRHRGDAAGDRGQAERRGCPPAGARSSDARCGNARKRSTIPITLHPPPQRAGLDAATLRAGGPSDAELDALHEQYTQEALTAGVFGAPSYVLPSGEIFWGQDRLELLERALKQLA